MSFDGEAPGRGGRGDTRCGTGSRGHGEPSDMQGDLGQPALIAGTLYFLGMEWAPSSN